MDSLTNEELGLDPNGFPPQDEYGNDLRQIEDNLLLTPAQRIRRNTSMLEFYHAARRARIARHGFDPADPEAPG